MAAPDQDHWLARPGTIRLLWIVFGVDPRGARARRPRGRAPPAVRPRRHLRVRRLVRLCRLRRAGRCSPRRWAQSSSGRTPTMMTSLAIPPGLVLILGGLLLPLLRGQAALRACFWRSRSLTLWLVCASAGRRRRSRLSFLGFDLILVKGDKLSRLFAFVFALMAFAGGALRAQPGSARPSSPRPSVYAGSAIGVAFAGDLITRLHLLGVDGHRLDAGGLVRRARRHAAPACAMRPSICSAACC